MLRTDSPSRTAISAYPSPSTKNNFSTSRWYGVSVFSTLDLEIQLRAHHLRLRLLALYQGGDPLLIVWIPVTCPERPLVGHVGGHLEQVSLRVLDELSLVVT